MPGNEIVFECKNCFDTEPENFYSYLKTKCKKCKKKEVRTRYSDKTEEKSLEKLQNLDKSGEISEAVMEFLFNVKVIDNMSMFDFLKNSKKEKDEIFNSTDMRFDKVSTCFNKLYEEVNSLKEEVKRLKKTVEELKEEK
jgi:hypothetical protein